MIFAGINEEYKNIDFFVIISLLHFILFCLFFPHFMNQTLQIMIIYYLFLFLESWYHVQIIILPRVRCFELR